MRKKKGRADHLDLIHSRMFPSSVSKKTSTLEKNYLKDTYDKTVSEAGKVHRPKRKETGFYEF